MLMRSTVQFGAIHKGRPHEWGRVRQNADKKSRLGEGFPHSVDDCNMTLSTDFKNWQDCTNELFFSLTVAVAGCRDSMTMVKHVVFLFGLFRSDRIGSVLFVRHKFHNTIQTTVHV